MGTSINPSLAVPLPVQSNRIILPTLVYGNTSQNKHNRQNEVLVLRRCSHRPCWPRKCTNPSRATDCIADAVASATSCGADDLGCQCEESNQSAITAAATSCVLAACGDQAIAVLTAAQEACAAVSASSAAGGASSTLASVSSAASSVVASVSSSVESVVSTYAPSSTTAESSSIAYTPQAEPSVTILPTAVPSSNATSTATSPPVQ